MIPGRTNRLALYATQAGVSRGPCAEYCGGAHALMSFHVVAREATGRVARGKRHPVSGSLRRLIVHFIVNTTRRSSNSSVFISIKHCGKRQV